MSAAEPIRVAVNGQGVSGLLLTPARPTACYVLAHGAGAGMTHPFLTAVAEGLTARNVATLRYQFPYMERRSNRPDSPEVAQAAVRGAVDAARDLMPRLPLFAGGKSFGGRMTSLAQAKAPLPDVAGLVFFGFPLHPAGKPSVGRAEHLKAVRVPQLFLQGTRDPLAGMDLWVPIVEELQATLFPVEGADHSFHVPARSGKTDRQVIGELLDAMVGWVKSLLSA